MLDHQFRCRERLSGIMGAMRGGPQRYDLINALITARGCRRYLEIGVRDPRECFERIVAPHKASVDPGLERSAGRVDHGLTSDAFFAAVRAGELHSDEPRWDVIFIDGLHRADQVWRDIGNALPCLNAGGVLFLHDCMPPLEEFARERYEWSAVSGNAWNGTTWKAFWRYLREGEHQAYLIDADWGLGVIDTSSRRGRDMAGNDFYEYDQYMTAIREGGFLRTAPEAIASWTMAGG